MTVSDGVHNKKYSFYIFVVLPPKPISLNDLNKIKPILVLKPQNVKLKQGESTKYTIP
jgi:hypothetical protein